MVDGLKAALVLVPLLVACAFALAIDSGHEGAGLVCVAGDAARNETHRMEDGGEVTLPRLLNAQSLQEARAFACVDAPEPTFTGDWQVRGYVGRRTASLGDEGRRTVEISYRVRGEPENFLSIWVMNRIPRFDDVPDTADLNKEDEVEAVTVQGREAELQHRQGNQFVISWSTAELEFAVFGQLEEPRSIEADVLPVLESLE